MTTLESSSSSLDSCPFLDAARQACLRMPPLWPLEKFVAVNPFLGLASYPFVDACDLFRRMAPGGMQMPLSFYAEKYDAGEIKDHDLDAAITHARDLLTGPRAEILFTIDKQVLKNALTSDQSLADGLQVLTVAEAIDAAQGTSWATAVTETIAQFCSEYFDAGQSAWRLPWRELPLYSAWREKAMINRNAEVLGLHQFRTWVQSLPPTAPEAISHLMETTGLASGADADFFHRQLMSIRGWAGHVQYRVWGKGMRAQEDDSLLQLLAIRLAYDAALLAQYDSPALREFWPGNPVPTETKDVLISHLWQLAHEHSWQTQLFAKLKAPESAPPSQRPSVQAVFCIDVRSEVFRRALEGASPGIETLGFAGFFGMPIESIPFGQHHGTAQCPVLLSPKFRVRNTLCHTSPASLDSAWKRQRLAKRLSYSWNSFKTSAISCFSFVETAGLAFGAKLFRDAFTPTKHHTGPSCEPLLDVSATDGTGIPLTDRVSLALGALRHMGLTKSFARLVLLCGHGSATTNNPFAASLDCGACGGNAGDANARVAAAILNDPAVRSALADHGIRIPDDTLFLAGLYTTTTDEVTLFDADAIPASHQRDLADLQAHLHFAAQASRKERSTTLGLAPDAPDLHRQILHRSLDWAQVRPEWGLAGNAAFIAAPRARTRNSPLDGRVFLHNYDHEADTDKSTLELIMIAPMVVASWINLQYYGSTVNNRIFGSGNKVIHNVVGTLGVCLGNGGDLQTGLPLQSLHDGKKWIHDPLRLHVLLEAPREDIAAVLSRHEHIRQLVDHGWILLFAIEDHGRSYHHYLPGGSWRKVETP